MVKVSAVSRPAPGAPAPHKATAPANELNQTAQRIIGSFLPSVSSVTSAGSDPVGWSRLAL